MILLPIPPMAKPRQTQSDKWKQRPVVVRYRSWCDEVRRLMGDQALSDSFAVTFGMPVPASYSLKRRWALADLPHRQRPDLDNMLKALMDCLLLEDGHVWRVHASKCWVDGPGYIVIEDLP